MSVDRVSELRRLDNVPAPFLVLVGVASVQCGAAVARGLFDELGATGMVLLRLTLASLLLGVVLRPRLRAWSGEAWRAALLLGAAVAGMNLLFYLAIRTVPLGIAVTLSFLGPLLLAVAQTRRALDVLWAVLAGGGVVLLGLDSTGDAQRSGLALALVGGLFWAAYILASARAGRALPGADGLVVSFAVAALLALPFGLAGAAELVHRPTLLLPVLAVALLSSVLPYGLELAALRRLPTRVFGILMSLQPAAAAAAGLLVLGQHLRYREQVALLLVSAASAGVTFGRREQVPIPRLPD